MACPILTGTNPRQVPSGRDSLTRSTLNSGIWWVSPHFPLLFQLKLYSFFPFFSLCLSLRLSQFNNSVICWISPGFSRAHGTGTMHPRHLSTPPARWKFMSGTFPERVGHSGPSKSQVLLSGNWIRLFTGVLIPATNSVMMSPSLPKLDWVPGLSAGLLGTS